MAHDISLYAAVSQDKQEGHISWKGLTNQTREQVDSSGLGCCYVDAASADLLKVPSRRHCVGSEREQPLGVSEQERPGCAELSLGPLCNLCTHPLSGSRCLDLSLKGHAQHS